MPSAIVSAAGVSLKSVSVTLPDDNPDFAPKHGADVMNANCSACHSPSMVLYQPHLSVEQWRAEIEKMRAVYKAPVNEEEVPKILAYLTSLSP